MPDLERLLHQLKTDKKLNDQCYEHVRPKVYKDKQNASARLAYDEALKHGGKDRQKILEAFAPGWEDSARAGKYGIASLAGIALGVALYLTPNQRTTTLEFLAGSVTAAGVISGLIGVHYFARSKD